MENLGARRVTIGQINMADRKGRYAAPTVEPDGCFYLSTFGAGNLHEKEPSKLDYADFDLYSNEGVGTFCYRFWTRHIDAQTGKETSRSYAEQVLALRLKTRRYSMLYLYIEVNSRSI